MSRQETARDRKLVLVIEDDSWTRTVEMALFAGEGYSVVDARNGEEGLVMAAGHEPDVIVLDLSLPRQSGLEVLRELKASPSTREIPVIVVSAYADLMPRGDAAQACALVQKPFDYDQLLRHVEHAITATRALAAAS